MAEPLVVQRSPTKKYWWVMYQDCILCTRDTYDQAADKAEQMAKKYDIRFQRRSDVTSNRC